MPRTVLPVVAAGRMRNDGQPLLHVSPDLILRGWLDADAPAVMAAFADPDIRFWHMRELVTEEDADSWIAGWRERWAAETDGSWAIVAGDDRLVGQIALRTVNLEFGDGQITYWVLPGSRHEGVATRATTEVSRWAFDDLGLHRLEIRHSVANPWSCRVAEKVGFALEGTMRSALLHEDGWHDMHVHARSSQMASLPGTTPGPGVDR
jgi:ribosomal-protein-alanine N-acetyltransferase